MTKKLNQVLAKLLEAHELITEVYEEVESRLLRGEVVQPWEVRELQDDIYALSKKANKVMLKSWSADIMMCQKITKEVKE